MSSIEKSNPSLVLTKFLPPTTFCGNEFHSLIMHWENYHLLSILNVSFFKFIKMSQCSYVMTQGEQKLRSPFSRTFIILGYFIMSPQICLFWKIWRQIWKYLDCLWEYFHASNYCIFLSVSSQFHSLVFLHYSVLKCLSSKGCKGFGFFFFFFFG